MISLTVETRSFTVNEHTTTSLSRLVSLKEAAKAWRSAEAERVKVRIEYDHSVIDSMRSNDLAYLAFRSADAAAREAREHYYKTIKSHKAALKQNWRK